MGAGEAMAFTESDFQSEGNVPRKFTSWIYSTFFGWGNCSFMEQIRVVFVSDWSSLDVPRWVHTRFCSYYLELSPRDLRFRVLSWESPGTWKHMQGIGPTDREGMRKFSLTSEVLKWFGTGCTLLQQLPGSDQKTGTWSKELSFSFRVLLILDCGFWSLGSGSWPHGGGLEYARNGASSS